MVEQGRVLIVDDEERLRNSLKKMLVMDGFTAETAENGEEGLNSLIKSPYDIAIIDLVMPKRDGMWLINEINDRGIDVGMIIASGYGTVDLVVRAMKLGAWDFIQKPVEYDLMKMIVQRSVERARLMREKREAQIQIKRQNEELKKANDKLRELDKLKTNFLSKAVHELRTPLTVITCGLELIKSELEVKGIDDSATNLDSTIDMTKSMTEIVNDMLDLNMIESGDIDLHMEEGSLSQVIHEAVGDTEPLLKKHDINLETDIKNGGTCINFSRGRIRQVMINLIGNAVKFTPEKGTITVSFKEEGDCMVASVKDTGCGIPSKHIESIFDEFYQVKGNQKRGAGLGLAICKKIIGAHKGKIWGESKVNKGTTISFSIPK
ncbi:MAG: ATP-binding protein [Deltaproteobacteria bacterium]|nr:ATP-binding protein [Deltaproteobacteria bacterium]